MKLLFVFADSSDYLGDSLFHGVRELLGERAVDFPKREPLYQSCQRQELDRLHGRGFTLYRQLPEVSIPRVLTVNPLAVHEYFRVVISSIENCWGWFVQLSAVVPPEKLIVLDGCDWPNPYPFCSYWLRHWRNWFLPRVSTRTLYFKRELCPETNWYRYYKLLPRAVCRRLRYPRNYRPIAFSIPEYWVVEEVPTKTKRFPRHIVDPEVAVAAGGIATYPFTTEEDYFADLRASTFGITTRRAGWDCLRHYELAASGCILCFRDLEKKPSSCAPHGLAIGQNCLTYSSACDLFRQIDRLTAEDRDKLLHGALAWARANTTRRRAEQFLNACGMAVTKTSQ